MSETLIIDREDMLTFNQFVHLRRMHSTVLITRIDTSKAIQAILNNTDIHLAQPPGTTDKSGQP